MEFLTEKRFSFVSAGAEDDAFGVVYFSGREALSFLYEFDITLVAKDAALNLGAVLQQPATFTIHRPQDEKVEFNGILAHFEQLHEFNGFVFYRAQLRPRLWWLTLTQHNQVCLNLPVVPAARGAQQPSLVGQTLKDGGLTTLDYEFRTEKSYAPHEYVCQYGETHYNFVTRWLEREGIYYFFEQTAMGEQLVMTDSMLSHIDLPQEGNLVYAPPSGLDAQHRDEVIKVLTCRQKMLPKRVLLRDHNYERPSLDVSGSATVDPQGRGEAYIYGESFASPEEGDRLAKLRAEELLCRKVEFFGESTVPFMMPGYTFILQNHYRADFNQRYLVTEVHHQGNQTGYLISGLQGGLSGQENAISYRNSFTAIPATTQFRPERLAQKPRISGILHATIDAEGSGEYAELDEQGRYKVRLPFDINSAHQDGKASCFLRMAQPYAGPKRGMHFPLPKGTEVLLTFIDGDPDRPVIAAAVPNPETPSPSTGRNQTESVIQTGSNNRMRFEDKQGSERIIMQSPTSNSWMRIGAPNDPPALDIADNLAVSNEGNGVRIYTEGGYSLYAGDRGQEEFGNQPSAETLSGTSAALNKTYEASSSLEDYSAAVVQAAKSGPTNFQDQIDQELASLVENLTGLAGRIDRNSYRIQSIPVNYGLRPGDFGYSQDSYERYKENQDTAYLRALTTPEILRANVLQLLSQRIEALVTANEDFSSRSQPDGIIYQVTQKLDAQIRSDWANVLDRYVDGYDKEESTYTGKIDPVLRKIENILTVLYAQRAAIEEAENTRQEAEGMISDALAKADEGAVHNRVVKHGGKFQQILGRHDLTAVGAQSIIIQSDSTDPAFTPADSAQANPRAYRHIQVDGTQIEDLKDHKILLLGGNKIENIEGSKLVSITGKYANTVTGDLLILVENDKGSTLLKFDGEGNIEINGTGNLFLNSSEANLVMQSAGTVNITGNGDLNVHSGGSISVTGTGDITLKSDKKIKINCG